MEGRGSTHNSVWLIWSILLQRFPFFCTAPILTAVIICYKTEWKYVHIKTKTQSHKSFQMTLEHEPIANSASFPPLHHSNIQCRLGGLKCMNDVKASLAEPRIERSVLLCSCIIGRGEIQTPFRIFFTHKKSWKKYSCRSDRNLKVLIRCGVNHPCDLPYL